jgi:hypothetical protein
MQKTPQLKTLVMKIKIYLLAAISGLLLTGYKKDAENSRESNVQKRLYQTSLGKTIQYDADGKPSTIEWSVAGYTYTKTFMYAQGKIRYSTRRNGQRFEEGEYAVQHGKIMELRWCSIDERGDTTAVNRERFSYNEQGLLAKHYFNEAYSEHTYNTSGNLVKTAHYNGQGKPTTVVEYEYTALDDRCPALGSFNMDGSGYFLPAFSKKLVASKKVTKVSTGIVTLRGQFTYEFDEAGFVSKAKWTALTPGDGNYEWTNRFQ